jgi:hypothetical protein
MSPHAVLGSRGVERARECLARRGRWRGPGVEEDEEEEEERWASTAAEAAGGGGRSRTGAIRGVDRR